MMRRIMLLAMAIFLTIASSAGFGLNTIYDDLNVTKSLQVGVLWVASCDVKASANGTLYCGTDSDTWNTTEEIFAVVNNGTFRKWTETISWGNLSSWSLDVAWSGQLAWPNLTSYPAACSAGEAITQLGDTLTCSAFQTGTEAFNTTEQMQDAAGALLGGTETLITVDYDDANNEIDFVVTNMINTTDEIFAAVDNSTFQKGTEVFNTTDEIFAAVDNGTFQTGTEVFNTTDEMFAAIDNNSFYKLAETLYGANITADSLGATQIDESSLVMEYDWYNTSEEIFTVIDNGTFQKESEVFNTTEEMQDAVMDAIDAGTQTRITVTYQDGSDDMDFVVDDMVEFNTTDEIFAAVDNSTFQKGTEVFNTTNEIFAAVDNSSFQYEIGSDCAAGNYAYGVNDDGSLDCRADTFNTTTEIQGAVNDSAQDIYQIISNETFHIDCSGIYGGTDADFCTDTGGTGGNSTDEIFAAVDNNSFYKLAETLHGDNITADSLDGAQIDESNLVAQTSWYNDTEELQDLTGAMVTGNTETLISVDYQDADGTIDFVVDNMLNTTEEMQDAMGAMLGGTETLITVTYQDATNDIDFVVDNMVNTTDEMFAAVNNNSFYGFFETLYGANLTADSVTGTQVDESSLVMESDWYNTTEELQDLIGAMVAGNTETLITVTYQDGDGTIDFVVDDMVNTTDHMFAAVDNNSFYKFAETLYGVNITADSLGAAQIDESSLVMETDWYNTSEQNEDFVGGMVTGNTETLITVTYQDADGTIDFVVDSMINTTDQMFAAVDNNSFYKLAETLHGDNITADTLDGDQIDEANLVVQTSWFNSSEENEDMVGAMVAGNTETLITVTYQDADGTIDFVVDDMVNTTAHIWAAVNGTANFTYSKNFSVTNDTRLYFGSGGRFCMYYDSTLNALVSTNNC